MPSQTKTKPRPSPTTRAKVRTARWRRDLKSRCKAADAATKRADAALSAALDKFETDTAASRMFRERADTWRTKPRGNVHEWAEAHRVIAQGPVPGRWVSRPYQKPVLEAITAKGVKGVLYVAASQGGGKTEICLNAAGFHMDADPSAVLLVEPTLDMADAFSKDRLAPMIAACDTLRGKVKDPKTRDSGNTTRHKVYPGGHITMVGANSASGLAMRPIRIVIFDEVDRYPLSAGTEGDPVKLAETRTFAYDILGLARKLFVTSPGQKYGRSDKLWAKTDQQEYMVPCQDCGHRQVMKWSQVHWDKDSDGNHQPETATYSCEGCGVCWPDAQRWDNVTNAPAASPDGNPYEAQAVFKGWHGFRLPGLCVLGSKLASYVEQWLDAQGNPELLRVFVNTVLCEWEDIRGESVDETGIMARREDWSKILPKGTELPAGVAVLTLGVDVQKDRVEYEVIGWGRGEESWSIEYGKVYGNVKEDASVLLDLDRLLLDRPFMHAKGFPLYIRAAAVDTGYATQAVYRYVKPRLRRVLPNGQPQFVFGVKGRSEYGRPLWPETSASKRLKLSGRVNLWTIGVDAGKDQVMARLSIAEPGPGYCHFPITRQAEYFKGLTAEQCRVVRRAGIDRRVWEDKVKGAPNEPFDLRVYGYAAVVGLQSKPFLLNLEAACIAIENAEDLMGGPVATGAARAVVAPKRRARRQRSRGYEA